VKEISFVNVILAAKESGIRVAFKKMGKVDCSCSRQEDTNIACPTCTANQARGTKDE
jgi:hypothetical protein